MNIQKTSSLRHEKATAGMHQALISLAGNMTAKEWQLPHLAALPPIAASISDIAVRRLSLLEIEGPVIQELRKEINLESHFHVDPHFLEHEKKEMK